MRYLDSSHQSPYITAICELGIKNQLLISRSLDLGLIEQATNLKSIDSCLLEILYRKALAKQSTHYIWRTQGDSLVRAAHAVNNGVIFSWNDPPSTGHPGENFNCRCWAEPIGADVYARQTIISRAIDNIVQWTDIDFLNHYINGNGTGVRLSETGYLSEVIEHYGQTLAIYDRVNEQIIQKARSIQEGEFVYHFGNHYSFDKVLFSLGDAIVAGAFVGKARKEERYLVITGIIAYEFYDLFFDPLQLIELISSSLGVNRERIADALGGLVDIAGTPYTITDNWQTKFNATILQDD